MGDNTTTCDSTVAADIHGPETDCKSPLFQCLAPEIRCYLVAAVSSFYLIMFRDLTDIMFRATAAAVAVSAIAVLLASSFGF